MLEEKVDIIILAGYSMLSDKELREERKRHELSTNETSLMGQNKALFPYLDDLSQVEKDLIQMPQRAAFESRICETISIVGDPDLEKRLPDLIREVEMETGTSKAVRFGPMYVPSKEELETLDRVDIDRISMAYNLIQAFKNLDSGNYVLIISCDLPLVTGKLIDDELEHLLSIPKEKRASYYASIIKKETIKGRLLRNYIKLRKRTKDGNDVKMTLKECNYAFSRPDLPTDFFRLHGLFYSLRKLKDPRSVLKGLAMFAPEYEFVHGKNKKQRFVNMVIQYGVSMDRALKIINRYVNGRLSVEYCENVVNEMIQKVTKDPSITFKTTEARNFEFSVDVDASAELSRDDKFLVEIEELSKHFKHLLDRKVVTKGKVGKVIFEPQYSIRSSRMLSNFFNSLFSFKSIRFQLKDDGYEIPCYRSKWQNRFIPLVKYVIDAGVSFNDRLFNRDEPIESLGLGYKEIIINPMLRYENLAKHLETAKRSDETVYVSGKLTSHGIWPRRIVFRGQKKMFYFSNFCDDPRCLEDKPSGFVPQLRKLSERIASTSFYKNLSSRLLS